MKDECLGIGKLFGDPAACTRQRACAVRDSLVDLREVPSKDEGESLGGSRSKGDGMRADRENLFVFQGRDEERRGYAVAQQSEC